MSTLISRLNELHAQDPNPDAIALGLEDPLSRWFCLAKVTPEFYAANKERRVLICEPYSDGTIWFYDDGLYYLRDWTFRFCRENLKTYYILGFEHYVKGMKLPCHHSLRG